MLRHIIIGSGPAGVAAAEGIRSLNQSDEITLVSEEAAGYYSRPGLAYYLTNEIPEKMLFPFNDRDFQRLRVQRIHARVTQVQSEKRQLSLSNGKTLGYDRLLLATGASATRLKAPGAELEGIVMLDTLEEARQIVQRARRAKAAVVVGGGITALELVEGLAAQRVRVHYLLRGERYWSNVLDEFESHIVEEALQHHGVTLHHHSEIEQVLGKNGKVSGVRTQSGEQIACDLLAVAIGVNPRLELAKQAGVAVERGVLVNEYLQTNLEHIYAAGDCAQVFDPLTGKSALASLWSPSREQGHAAGLNMAGQPSAYRKKPSLNVTRLAGLTTTIIGSVGQGSDPDLLGIARGDSESWRQLPDALAAQAGFEINRVRLMIGQRTLLGAVVMGDQKLSIPLQTLIGEQVELGPLRQALLAPGAPISDLLIEFWSNWKSKPR